MTSATHTADHRGGYLRVARSRGSLSGLLLVALGVWGGLIPFLGPVFNYAFTPDLAWTWTSGRFWLEVLPGVATIIAGLLLTATANRAVGVFAGYLACAAGAWFILGPIFGPWVSGTGMSPGLPIGGNSRRVVEQVGFFAGLGAVILFLAAQALGRFAVRSVRDVQASERHDDRYGTTPIADRDATRGSVAYPAEPNNPDAGTPEATRPGVRRR